MAAKSASGTKSAQVVKKTSRKKAALEKKPEKKLLHTGLESALVTRAVHALLKHHKTTSDEKLSLLGTEQPVQVQLALLRAPERSTPKPIRVLVPHPFFKLADKVDESCEEIEEPEICLIVKEESKPWCQEMIEKFPDHMGCVKKVLGLQSLRKKHAQYDQRRELLQKYNFFIADDRILPMLTKALGKEFFKAKKQPVPINLTRKEALPFAIQKALSATYMTLSKGTCVMIRAGHTGMKVEQLVENIVEIANTAVPKIPRKWANIQVVSIKIPESVALPVYNKTPQVLKEIAQRSGSSEQIPHKEKKEKEESVGKGSAKSKSKSPLLQALKKVESKGKMVKTSADKSKERDHEMKQKNKRKEAGAASSTKDKSVEKEDDQKKRKQRSRSVDSVATKKTKKEEPETKKDFIESKKFKGSKKGYVFRAGIQGTGYYIDIKPEVDRMALQALMRMSKASNKGGRQNKKNKNRRRSY